MTLIAASIGGRIARARREWGLTQQLLASAIGMHRTALAKIETGDRRVSAVELADVSRELDRRIEWFVGSEPPAIASYRASAQGAAPQAIDRVIERVAADVEFVLAEANFLPANLPDAYDRPVDGADAETLAATARTLLGLADDQRAVELDRLVARIGLLAFTISVGGGADGATVLLRSGAVTVVNGDGHIGRRRLTLAHELGHYLIQDLYTVDWKVAASEGEAVESTLDQFARALLLPASDLGRRWQRWLDRGDLRDASVLAGHHYRVDMPTLARRLAEIGSTTEHEAAQVRRVRTKQADIIEHDLTVPHEMDPPSLPPIYQRAVLDLYRREVISTSRAIDLLLGTFDENGLPDLPTLPEGEIWAVTS